ncbi:MAG: flagellin lysine-N-methylase [Fibrobacter sp.]|nr:flagellin lysine-N-methylase [Fibrobacter sp.]
MILRKPDFYDRFKCIAGQCTDTCCVGWEIDVDEASQEAYRKVSGTFGDKLRDNIEDGHFKLLPHDRCPFLDGNNLCEIFANLGEGALCNICREHPRFVEVFGDIMEKGIGLCCEEAVRLLLEGEGPLTFTGEVCDEPEDELDDDDREIRDQVLYERERIFASLADSSLALQERLHDAFGFSTDNFFAPLKDANAYVELLANTESFGPAWDEALARIKERIAAGPVNDQGFFSDNESARILAYLVYRHYAKCLFDGYEQGKRLFAVFFWNTVRFFTRELAGDATHPVQDSDFATRINAIKILSRQLEYCEENKKRIEGAFESIPENLNENQDG